MKPKLNAAFWKWFGNSVVVDGNGDPLIVYHGTTKKFHAFQPSPHGTFGEGIYFTTSRQSASVFAGGGEGAKPVIIKAFLNIERPYRFKVTHSMNMDFLGAELVKEIFSAKDAKEIIGSADDSSDFGSEIKEQLDVSHDGIIIEWPDKIRDFIAFYPTQAKAVNNDGTWDSDDADIRSNPNKRQYIGVGTTWRDSKGRTWIISENLSFGKYRIKTTTGRLLIGESYGKEIRDEIEKFKLEIEAEKILRAAE